MRKTKDQVISELNSRLLTLEDLLLGKEKENEKLQNDNKRLSKSFDNWREKAIAYQKASARDKQDREIFARKATIAEQKSLPRHRLSKWLYYLSYSIDKLMNGVKKN